MSATSSRLGAILGPELLEALDAYVDKRVAYALAELAPARSNGAPEWLTLEQAGDRLGCTADAVRMRVNRGRLTARHDGRRVYVSRTSVDGAA